VGQVSCHASGVGHIVQPQLFDSWRPAKFEKEEKEVVSGEQDC